MRKVVAIGETVLDIIFKNEQPVTAKPGGSSFNALISLGRLDVPSVFISETGNDKVGDIIIAFLQSNGIDTKYITRFDNGKSALALAFLNEKGDADYDFYKNYPKERLQVDFPTINTDDFILFGSFFALNPALRPQIETLLNQAKANNAIVYYDPNFRTSHLHELDELKPAIFQNFNDSSIIRGSDEDFYNILNTYDIHTIYNTVCKFSQPLIYTMNSRGIIVKTADDEFVFPAQKINPLSTIGAGDTFNSGVAYALFKYSITKNDIKNLSFEMWQNIVEIAVLCSSEVCQSYDNYISNEFANSIKNINK